MFGLLQLGLLTGCGQGLVQAEDHLLSQSEEQAAGIAANPLPVRISTSFFQKDLSAVVTVNRSSTPSAVSWEEFPTTEPAPQGPYLADFRDHTGCATLIDASDAQLCFTIQGDVDSVKLAQDSLQIQGLEPFIQQSLDKELPDGCHASVQNAKLVSSSRTPTGFELKLVADKIISGDQCPTPRGTVTAVIAVNGA